VGQREHFERHHVVEAVDARDPVGDREHRADLGQRGALASRPVIRLLRMLVISSGLICMGIGCQGSLRSRVLGGADDLFA